MEYKKDNINVNYVSILQARRINLLLMPTRIIQTYQKKVDLYYDIYTIVNRKKGSSGSFSISNSFSKKKKGEVAIQFSHYGI